MSAAATGEMDIHALASLARRLLKRETTLVDLFDMYEYGRQKWLIEAEKRGEVQVLGYQSNYSSAY